MKPIPAWMKEDKGLVGRLVVQHTSTNHISYGSLRVLTLGYYFTAGPIIIHVRSIVVWN